jgi:hypothetical protein
MNYMSQAAHNTAKHIITAFLASRAVITQTGSGSLHIEEFVEVTDGLPLPPDIILGVLTGIEAAQLDTENHTVTFAEHLILPPLDKLKVKVLKNAEESDVPEDVKKKMLVNTFLVTTYLHLLSKNVQILTKNINPTAGISCITLPPVTEDEVKSTMDFFLA